MEFYVRFCAQCDTFAGTLAMRLLHHFIGGSDIHSVSGFPLEILGANLQSARNTLNISLAVGCKRCGAKNLQRWG